MTQTIRQTSETIKIRLEQELPNLLDENKVRDFDGYTVGYPFRTNDRECCVRFSRLERGNSFSLDFQIQFQIVQANEKESYGYFDAAKEFLDREFNPFDYGFTDFDYTMDVVDDYRQGLFELYAQVTITNGGITDCDMEA